MYKNLGLGFMVDFQSFPSSNATIGEKLFYKRIDYLFKDDNSMIGSVSYTHLTLPTTPYV